MYSDHRKCYCTGNMLAYPVEHVIYGDYVYQTWDPKMIEDLMGFFTPKNMRIDVVSKSVKSEGTFEIC